MYITHYSMLDLKKNETTSYSVKFYSNDTNKPTQYNTLLLGYQSARVNVVEEGNAKMNIVQSHGATRVATSSSTGNYRYQNLYSDNSPLFKLISLSNNIDDTSTSNYNLSLAPNYMDMKRATDVSPRLRLNFVNGGIYAGDGTKEPTSLLQGTPTGFGIDGDLSLKNHSWNHNVIQLGGYILWVDSTGNLRIKQGRPNSDTDGKIVGT